MPSPERPARPGDILGQISERVESGVEKAEQLADLTEWRCLDALEGARQRVDRLRERWLPAGWVGEERAGDLAGRLHWRQSALRLPDKDSYDAEWIGLNMYLFEPLAAEGFDFFGRGAVVVNLKELIQGCNDERHPLFYLPANEPDWSEHKDLAALDREFHLKDRLNHYRPTKEFVLALVKPINGAAYRINLTNDEYEIRGWYVDAESDERQARFKSRDKTGRRYSSASKYTALWELRRETLMGELFGAEVKFRVSLTAIYEKTRTTHS